jgi:hypothetical protein
MALRIGTPTPAPACSSGASCLKIPCCVGRALQVCHAAAHGASIRSRHSMLLLRAAGRKQGHSRANWQEEHGAVCKTHLVCLAVLMDSWHLSLC